MVIDKAIQAHWCRLKKPASQFEETPVMTPPLRRDGNMIYSSMARWSGGFFVREEPRVFCFRMSRRIDFFLRNMHPQRLYM